MGKADLSGKPLETVDLKGTQECLEELVSIDSKMTLGSTPFYQCWDIHYCLGLLSAYSSLSEAEKGIQEPLT